MSEWTAGDIKRVLELDEKAKVGPWKVTGPWEETAVGWEPYVHGSYSIANDDYGIADASEKGGTIDHGDANFIAESRILLPRAVAEIERLQTRIDDLQRELDSLDSDNNRIEVEIEAIELRDAELQAENAALRADKERLHELLRDSREWLLRWANTSVLHDMDRIPFNSLCKKMLDAARGKP